MLNVVTRRATVISHLVISFISVQDWIVRSESCYCWVIVGRGQMEVTWENVFHHITHLSHHGPHSHQSPLVTTSHHSQSYLGYLNISSSSLVTVNMVNTMVNSLNKHQTSTQSCLIVANILCHRCQPPTHIYRQTWPRELLSAPWS